MNLSAAQLVDTDLVAQVTAALRRAQLDPAALQFELTETILMSDVPAALKILTALKDLGVSLAVDDFGTGYSSLAYLQRFPVDTLKIDRTFVEGLGRRREAHVLLEAMISMAKALGLRTIAEGVENAAQLAAVRDLGCDGAQGFHIARPADADTAQQILTAPVFVPRVA